VLQRVAARSNGLRFKFEGFENWFHSLVFKV